MATLTLSTFRAQPKLTTFSLGFPSTPQFLSFSPFKSSPSSFRCTSSRRLQTNHRVLTVFAANPNTGGGKSPKEGSNVKETSDGAAQGPPFLTILAGFSVFFLVCWIIGSIVMWLISLVVNLPPTK